MSAPDTRPSLLLRIRDLEDREAWEEFEGLYRQVIHRMAIARGMQVADADDLTQQVLWSVSQAIDRFKIDNKRAKFRTWLRTIARRAIVNALARSPQDLAEGGSDVMAALHQQPARDGESKQLELDYRREVFLVAAAALQREFHPTTWQAFWETVVLDKSIDEVATRLGCSRGSIYTARCRVIQRLKQEVLKFDDVGAP